MSEPNSFVVAGLQCDPQIARPDLNLEMIADLAALARDAGAKLAIFPECAVSGYCFDSSEEAMEVAEPVPGPATAALVAIAGRLNLQLVVGMLERAGERLYNVAALVGPGGLIGTYRKIHLPFLGVDRFTAHGRDGFQVYDTSLARIGVNICTALRTPTLQIRRPELGGDPGCRLQAGTHSTKRGVGRIRDRKICGGEYANHRFGYLRPHTRRTY